MGLKSGRPTWSSLERQDAALTEVTAFWRRRTWILIPEAHRGDIKHVVASYGAPWCPEQAGQAAGGEADNSGSGLGSLDILNARPRRPLGRCETSMRASRTQILSSAQCMKKAEFSITSGSDVQIDQDSCTPADWFLNRIVRQQQSTHVRTDHSSHTGRSTMHRSSVHAGET